MDIIRIALIGIAGVLLSIQLKAMKSEYATFVSLATTVVIFFYVIARLEVIVDAINKIQNYININEEYIEALIKMTGITYIAELSSNICKDTGHSAIASQIEIFAKLSMLAVSMPIITALLETIDNCL